nr:polysaccharide pyruvyl transferase family protein [uncultured Pseudomonas sp.]
MLKAILFNDTSHNRHHGCQIVVKQIYALAAAAGIQIIKACPMRHDWRHDARLQADIGNVDLCIVNGEGTLHDDARAAQMLVELAPFCRNLGVSCFLINSVWQNNQALVEPARAFTKIYLRDCMSQRELEAAGIASQVVPDLTLSVTPPRAAQARKGILVNGSFYEEKTQEAWAALHQIAPPTPTYLSIWAMPQLQVGKGFPSYVWKSLRSRFKAWRGRTAARFVTFGETITRQQIKLLRWKYGEAYAPGFLARLAASEGVVTGRFHCVTLCILTETPFFAIGSNTHKIEALLDACQLHGRVYSNYAAALADRRHIAFSEDELRAVREFVGNSRSQAERMFADIAACVVGGKR